MFPILIKFDAFVQFRLCVLYSSSIKYSVLSPKKKNSSLYFFGSRLLISSKTFSNYETDKVAGGNIRTVKWMHTFSHVLFSYNDLRDIRRMGWCIVVQKRNTSSHTASPFFGKVMKPHLTKQY